MGLAYVAIAIAAAAFAGRAIARPFTDGDLFWQKHLGAYVIAQGSLPNALGPEAFAATGAPWTPQEWLTGCFAALIVPDRLWIGAIVAASCVAIAMTITALRARDAGATPFAIAFCSGLLAFDCEGSFGIRAQVFAWPLFALVLYLLDRRGRAVFWVFPVVALWANLHASVMLAVPIVWLDAAFTRTRERIWLAILVPFATLATPLGVRLPLYALMLVRSPIRHFIDEWQRVNFHHDFFWFGAVPMLALALAYLRTLVRERPRDVALLALLAAMTGFAVRNAALLGFVLMPLGARAFELVVQRFAWWPRDPLRSFGPRLLAFAGGVLTAVLVFLVSLRPAPANGFVPPIATFARIAALPGEHRVYCYDFAICSIALDYPNLRVLMDGRADPYPVKIWYDWDAIRKTLPGWRGLVQGYGIDVVIAHRNGALDKALRRQRAWRPFPTPDRCCAVYVRARSPSDRRPDLTQ